MDATKQNLKKKAHDKVMRLIAEASARDAAPGVVKEASTAESEALSFQTGGSVGSSETERRAGTSSTHVGASAQQKGKGKTSLRLALPVTVGSASQNPPGYLPLPSQDLAHTSAMSSVVIDVEDHIPSSTPGTPPSTIDPAMESFDFSSLEKILPSADASPAFMRELDATSANPSRVLVKRKGSSPSPPSVKKSKLSYDAMVIHTTSGVMAPSPLDSNVQASSALSERDSQVLALSPLASFAHTNPYVPQKGPQVPRSRLSPSSAGSLAFIHSLRQKGLDVPPATTQGAGVNVSFPGVVDKRLRRLQVPTF